MAASRHDLGVLRRVSLTALVLCFACAIGAAACAPPPYAYFHATKGGAQRVPRQSAVHRKPTPAAPTPAPPPRVCRADAARPKL